LRLTIVSQYYPPEVTAAAMRVSAFASGLAQLGHEIEVICEVPNHPSGIVDEGFRGKRVVVRELDGVQVRHIWVRASERKTVSSRVLNYGSFLAHATTQGSSRPRPDVILASSPPLPGAMAARSIAARHRSPWVMDVRDLWPEAAVALGELKPGRVVSALERVEARLYRSADAIVTVTEPFRQQIAATVDDPEKLTVIANGTTREWMKAGEQEPDREGVGLPMDKFVWTYAGNLGLAQGLESAVDAAAILGEGFHLELVGDGARAPDLRERAEASGADVSFRGLVEPAEAARLVRASDALLVSLADRPELAKFVPSKLFDYCAVGRPLIVAAAGEPQRLAVEAGAAIGTVPGDSAELADAVRALRDHPSRAETMSAAARKFAGAHLREDQIGKLERLLLETIERSSAGKAGRRTSSTSA
jgi:glycosyltransferase involved in cell wall biosynthesis